MVFVSGFVRDRERGDMLVKQAIDEAVAKLGCDALYVKQTPLFCELVYRPNGVTFHQWQFPPTKQAIKDTMRAMGFEAAQASTRFNWHEAAVLTKVLNCLMARLDKQPINIGYFAAR